MRGHYLPLTKRQALEAVITDSHRRLESWRRLPDNPNALAMDRRIAAERVVELEALITRKQKELDALEATQ